MSIISRRTSFPLIVALLLPACVGQSPVDKTEGPAIAKNPPAMTANPPKLAVAVPEPAGPPLTGPGIADRPDVRAFIAEMSRKHGFSEAELTRTFRTVTIKDTILSAISKPYEAQPWYAYKKLFLTDTRIAGGIEFRRRHAQALTKAERKYGVSPEIVTAIIGVESSYGQKPGNHRVIDALSTLGFDYPKRGPFFRGELEHFLLLCREEGMDPSQPTGSYAGAMGMPQFMPSSYRKLAADGDGDGRRDIWSNPADAIASVARYFAANGWRTGEAVAVPAGIDGAGNPPTQLSAAGLSSGSKAPRNLKASLLKLEEESGPAYWWSYHNFNVIMRYNHSPLYAMAAHELSQRIAAGAETPRSP